MMLLLALLVVSCGPAVAPRSLGELEALVKSPRAERAESVAAEAWSEGMRYLRLSRDALDDGDAERSARFAELGVVHVKTAIATARRVLAGERLEQARRDRHDIDLELERVRSDLDALEHDIEREHTRAHLEQVVDETRRRAAADEELREKASSEQDREALRGARLEVARELVGRVALGLAALRALAGSGAVLEERLLPTEGSVEAAIERLKAGDMVGVQEHCEAAGVETRRVWDDLWAEQGEGALGAALAGIEQALAGAGLEPRREELGVGVSLGGTVKGGALDKGANAALRALAAALAAAAAAGSVLVLAVAVDRTDAGATGLSSEAGDKRAAAAAAALVQSGLPESVVSHRGLGATVPLDALLGGKGDRVAVLLVPVPGAK